MSFLFFELILTISFIIPNLIFGILLGVVIRKSNLVQLILVIIACILFNVYEIYINCLITGIDIIKINITSINESAKFLSEYFGGFNYEIYRDINILAMPLYIIVGGTGKCLLSYFFAKIIIERIDGRIENKYELKINIRYWLSVCLLILYFALILIWGLYFSDIISYSIINSVILLITITFSFCFYVIVAMDKMGKKEKITMLNLFCFLLCGIIFIFIAPVFAIRYLILKERNT